MVRHKAPPDLELSPDEGGRSSGGTKSTTTNWSTLDYIADVSLSSAPTPSDPASSRFEIRRVLGSGGFGVVDLAWDNVLQREVALKRPLARLGALQQQLFLDEARLAARIRHPGIIVVHDVEVDGNGQPFIVYEYHPGGSLKGRLQGEAWTLPAALTLMLELVEALAEAHRNGLTHRDLKPGNILFDRTDHAQIADFGLAVDEASQRDLSGEITGTYRYMAPEQFRGEVDRLDGRTDLWALGVIFYELLTGHHPFPGEDFDEMREQVLNREPRPPRQWVEALPPRVERLCLKLLAKPVADRCGSATELAEELGACLGELEPPAPPLVVVTPQPMRAVVLALLASAVLAAIVTSVVIVSILGGGTSPPPSITKTGQPDDRGVWKPLLTREPQAIVALNPKATKHFEEGLFKLESPNPALMQLGELDASDYSLRVVIKASEWNGFTGLFLGFRPSTSDHASDQALLIGIARNADGRLVIMRSIMKQQGGGLQHPETFFQLQPSTSALSAPKDGAVTVQVEVSNGHVAAIYLNQNRMQFPVAKSGKTDPQDQFPARGRFGVYLLGGGAEFSDAYIFIKP